ncbi:MAG: Rossmann-like fold-containing protein, partial [Alphaproteobacteria bacterium]
NGTDTVMGPKISTTYEYNEPHGRILGVLDGISVEVGAQHDKPRGYTAYVGVKFKIGLTNIEKNSNIFGFERHMVELVRRDPDIVIGKGKAEPKKIELSGQQGYTYSSKEEEVKEGVKTGEKSLSELLKEFGLPENAAWQEVRKKYREYALKYHPDKNKDGESLFVYYTGLYDKIKSILFQIGGEVNNIARSASNAGEREKDHRQENAYSSTQVSTNVIVAFSQGNNHSSGYSDNFSSNNSNDISLNISSLDSKTRVQEANTITPIIVRHFVGRSEIQSISVYNHNSIFLTTQNSLIRVQPQNIIGIPDRINNSQLSQFLSKHAWLQLSQFNNGEYKVEAHIKGYGGMKKEKGNSKKKNKETDESKKNDTEEDLVKNKKEVDSGEESKDKDKHENPTDQFSNNEGNEFADDESDTMMFKKSNGQKQFISKDDKNTQNIQVNEKTRYKKRLFVGEGIFSYTVSFLKKHPELSRFIIATELDSEKKLLEKHGDSFKKNMDYLHNNNVDIMFGVDAKKLHEDDRLSKHRFKRIQFNCPYYKNSPNTRVLVEQFFQSARQLQKIGDRIHVVLPQSDSWKDLVRYQGVVYAIYAACTKAGYQYVKKRQFTSTHKEKNKVWKRYPGYEHVETKGGGSAPVVDNSREYIFEKKFEEKEILSSFQEAKKIADELRKYNKHVYKLEGTVSKNNHLIDEVKQELKKCVDSKKAEMKKPMTNEQNKKKNLEKRCSEYKAKIDQYENEIKKIKEEYDTPQKLDSVIRYKLH